MATPAGNRTEAGVRAVRGALEAQRRAQREAGVPDRDERIESLRKLGHTVARNRDHIVHAISRDFGGRSRGDVLLTELAAVLEASDWLAGQLRSFSASVRHPVPWWLRPARAYSAPQPRGVVGIIGSWHQPLAGPLLPVAGALAAGNRVLLKPSERAPRTAVVLRYLLGRAFQRNTLAVFEGGAEVGAALAVQPLDQLDFTGTPAVARRVMAAAGRNLTPVRLHTGGPTPVLLGEGFPLDTAAHRIAVGKLAGAGQSCVAPDYLLVPLSRYEESVEAVSQAIESLYPSLRSGEYPRIVGEDNFRRMEMLAQDARDRGGKVVPINPSAENLPEEERVFPPTLVLEATRNMRVLQEEIAGPILPVVAYDDLDDALAFIRGDAPPLVLYQFTRRRRDVRRAAAASRAAGVSVNDVAYHFAPTAAGVEVPGGSGVGRWAAREWLTAFSRGQGVVRRGAFWTPLDWLRAPGSRAAATLVRARERRWRRR